MHGGGCVWVGRVFVWLHAGVCEREKGWRTYSHLICLCSAFCFRFCPGYQSPGQTPWTHWTLKTMILDHPWTMPPDSSRPDSHYIHLSFNVRFSRPSALLSCQPRPFYPVSPPLPSRCLLAVNWPWRRLLWQIWMATSFLLSNFFNSSLATNFL